MTVEQLDVLIVGAGISGIGAAVHLQKYCPGKSFAILERRADIGGTWDLFRYPGIRSDSDMYTLGFRFKPWTAEKAIADGPAILEYLHDTVREYALEPHLRFGQHVQRAAWSSETATWTVQGSSNGVPMSIRCNMLFMCAGYYDYDKGFTPDYPGRDQYQGIFIHPQHWPGDLDYRGKKVVVIGSGATAVTLVPAMANGGAAQVTMLQRSPTWLVSRPAIDQFAHRLQRWLPAGLAYWITRWRNVLFQLFVFRFARKRPAKMRARLLKMVREELGPEYDVKTHFTPRYNPWEERLCLVPDSDIFAAIRDNKVAVVTDRIERLTPGGIRLESGTELAADIIVSATGLNLQTIGGLETTVDGVRVDYGSRILYKGILFNDVPNLAMWFGYTNASWTLKADLTSEYMCRLLRHMDAIGSTIATPRLAQPDMELESFVDFSSGYFRRAAHLLPKQGNRLPWKLHQNYARDILLLRHGPIDDEMEFRSAQRAANIDRQQPATTVDTAAAP